MRNKSIVVSDHFILFQKHAFHKHWNHFKMQKCAEAKCRIFSFRNLTNNN